MIYTPKLPNYEHQQYVFDLFKDSSFFALFTDMGTGKTKMLLDIAGYQHLLGRVECLIVVAPKFVVKNWVNTEIPRHCAVPYETVLFSKPLKVEDKKKINNVYLSRGNGKLKIVVINQEGIRTDDGYRMLWLFLNSYRCMFAIDESTCIKSDKAILTKRALKLSPFAVTRAIATGYPSPQSTLDYFGQMEFLKKGLSGHRQFFFFKQEYAIIQKIALENKNRSYDKVVGFKNQDKLTALLDTFSVRIRKDQCLDLPPRTQVVLDLTLTPEQKRVYEDLRHRALAELDQGEVSVTSALTKVMKLHQVVCGHTHLDDGQWPILKHTRIDLLSDLVESLGAERAIIWAHYRKDIEQIVGLLKGRVSVLYGGTDIDKEMEKWRSGESQFFVINAKSGSKGLTLTEAAINIYYSYDYNLENWIQSGDRIYRIGQDRPVTDYIFLARDTVEEKVYQALINKKKLGDSILDNIRNYLK